MRSVSWNIRWGKEMDGRVEPLRQSLAVVAQAVAAEEHALPFPADTAAAGVVRACVEVVVSAGHGPAGADDPSGVSLAAAAPGAIGVSVVSERAAA